MVNALGVGAWACSGLRPGDRQECLSYLWLGRGVGVGLEVRSDDVLLEHAVGVEEGAVEGDGVAADFLEAGRVVGEQGGDGLFELVVEGVGVVAVIGLRVGGGGVGADGPAGDAGDAAFEPPAVEDA